MESVAMLPLSRGTFALVDEQDIEYLAQFNWCVHSSSNLLYAARWTEGNETLVLLHREIMRPPNDKVIDHINGLTLDNRRCNLRICTQKQNTRNRRKPNLRKAKGASSKYKGVRWHKGDQRWRATINVDRKQKHLGNFLNEIDAAKAYDEAAIKYFGPFARLNILEDTSKPSRIIHMHGGVQDVGQVTQEDGYPVHRGGHV